MAKKILLIYPGNFLDNNAGNNNYVYSIVKFIKTLNYDVDFLSVDGLGYDFSNFADQNKNEHLVNNFYFYKKTEPKKTFQIFKIKKTDKYIKYYFCNIKIWKKRRKTKLLYGFIDDAIISFVQEIIKKNKYDFIYVHYIWIAELLLHVKLPKDCKKIYSMHDANFLQIAYRKDDFYDDLKKEITILRQMDKILCISFDEQFLFQRLLPKKEFYFLPPPIPVKPVISKKDIDILFLGYSNPYNIEAVKWLVDNILPQLNKQIHLTICGKVLKMLSETEPQYYKKLDNFNVNKIDYAEDLDVLYSRTKISVSPLWGGTGMKIKTIDAMSRGIPVVATLLGVDGFPDKYESGILVSNNPEDFSAYIEKLYFDDVFYQETKQKMMTYYKKYLGQDAVNKIIQEIF